MKFRYQGSKQRYAGLLLILFGGFGVVASRQYTIGTATDMGPGYFPMVLGYVLLLLGVAAQFDTSKAEVEPVDVKEILTLISICAGIVAFAELIERLGLAAAILGALLCACVFRLRRHFVEILVIYVVLTAVAVGLFIHVLELPLRAFILPSL